MTTYNPQTVVITGASAGIGRAIAHEFAKRGARIGLFARNIDGLNGAKREVEALGGKGLCIVGDVADPDRVEAMATEVEEAFGPIDVWVNNAMTSFLAPLKEVTPEEYRRVTDVTYHGQVYGAMAALRRMRPRNFGKIVFVGSALAYRGIPLQTAYCGAKHAIQGFCDSLRAELIHEGSGIEITMVQLPGINTTQFKLARNKMPNKPRPMGAIYEPEVAARAVVYAADHDEREIFVGLPAFQTIWGNKLFPGLADQVLGRTGYSGQQTDEPADPNARDYLFEPVPGDHGYKGGFEGQARSASPALWLTMHKWLGTALVGGLVAASTAAILALSDDGDGNRTDRDGTRVAGDSGGKRGGAGKRRGGDDVYASRNDKQAGRPRYIDHTVYPEDGDDDTGFAQGDAYANPRDAKASAGDDAGGVRATVNKVAASVRDATKSAVETASAAVGSAAGSASAAVGSAAEAAGSAVDRAEDATDWGALSAYPPGGAFANIRGEASAYFPLGAGDEDAGEVQQQQEEYDHHYPPRPRAARGAGDRYKGGDPVDLADYDDATLPGEVPLDQARDKRGGDSVVLDGVD